MKYTIQYRRSGSDRWLNLPFCQGVTKAWAEGWHAAKSDEPGPRSAYRAVDESQSVLWEIESKPSASLGMVAGSPRWQDYTRAAVDVLKKASRASRREYKVHRALCEVEQTLSQLLKADEDTAKQDFL